MRGDRMAASVRDRKPTVLYGRMAAMPIPKDIEAGFQ